MLSSRLSRTVLDKWVIVAVDDDSSSLNIAQMMLSHHGAKVYTAVNGEDALKLIQQHEPHLVLSDLSMPVMNGWQLLEALQKDDRLKDIPVVAFTAHAMTGDREKVMAAGFHGYLVKPLKPSTFVGELIALMETMAKPS
jgi:CheY-like chemotaxis protein